MVELASSLDLATVRRVQALCERLRATPLAGVLECVPAFVTVTVFYDPLRLSGEEGWSQLEAWVARGYAESEGETAQAATREVVFRVRYGGEDGPDLMAVAAALRLSPEAVIALHSEATYTVGAIGFSPGFPYLLGLPKPLTLPRRATPRARVAAGSVAIAAGQAGIYPQATPGGWHILGRTESPLFMLDQDPPALLAVGDRVRFVPETGRES